MEIQMIIFVAFSLRSVIQDIKRLEIYPREICFGIFLILVFVVICKQNHFVQTMTLCLCTIAVFWLVHFLTSGKLALGDVLFSGLISSLGDFWLVESTLLIATISGLIIYFVKFFLGSDRHPIPFTPLLFFGCCLSFFYFQIGGF